jgi:DNA polymerase-3 subunit gamma/tau
VVDDPAGDQTDPGGEPYQSLYRRYRPQRFADVRGQDHVTLALRNAVREQRVAHAYLFSGPRGTGKTSTARILAMALNCEHLLEGEPDGTCPSCLSIKGGSSFDVQELDAASNRKLDEMRDLLSRVSLGTRGRWKVYIVDEVHQLTADAASALLKTLEEPPAHVIFVLATTDPQKVLPTIRSRTQHYEFRLLGADVLAGLLADVNRRAALGVAPEAIDLVVRRGHGSARDALSVLDQVAAAGTVDDEMTVVGDIVEALADRDAGRVLIAVAEGIAAGRDPRRLAVDLLEHLRNGFLASQARGLVQLPDDAAAEVEAQANRLGLAALVRAMEVVGQAATDMRDAVDPRVALEVALVRVASPAADVRPAALLERIEQLERRVAAGGALSPAPSPPPAPASPPPAPAAPASPLLAQAPAAQGRPTSAATRPSAGASPSEAVLPPDEAGPRPEHGSGGESGPASRPPRPAVPPTPARQPVGDAPPMPRPSLGAHRRAMAPPVPPGAAPSSTGGTDPVPRSSPGGPAGGVPSPRPAGAPRPGGPAGDLDLPTRDELTKAWGDRVLPSLPARIKAYLALGRFVEVEGSTTVYAVPDAGLLGRAGQVHADFEAALAAHFGRPVPVRLILDEAPVPAAAAPPPEEDDDPARYDLTEMEDVDAAVMSPEQRVLDAFPGAEEVTP